MKLTTATLLLTTLVSSTDAFTSSSHSRVAPTTAWGRRVAPRVAPSTTRLYATDDDEVERLKRMAAQLRAEAAKLEAEQQGELAKAAEKAFRKFDTNQDGDITLKELKEGLEKAFKTELPENRVKKLMEDFDKSGDGALQLDEFVTVEQFRNKLDALARDEKAQALDKARAAKQEEEAAQFLQATLELINDKPPTGTDKILSILPYFLPLLDGLQFASFLVMKNPDNLFLQILALFYIVYRSIPFGGLIAFFGLSILSGNPRINRLIRFNMQQAIYLDIALFFPGLLGALGGLLGAGVPASLAEVGSDGVFAVLLLAVGYAATSSLAGFTPDKIPLISDAVKARMPTVDMFDDQGRFQPRNRKDDDESKM